MESKAIEILSELRKYDELYIIGHDKMDSDSFFSSYILYRILSTFITDVNFCMLDDYTILEEDKKIIEDFKIEEPLILKRSDIKEKPFILVDHNDPSQSLKEDAVNIVLAIDHHLDTKRVEKTYSEEYTSTGLYIYDIFKDIYNFNKELLNLIALTVMTDSCYLTTSRYKESDKELFLELNSTLLPSEMKNKYFKTMDFTLDMDYNIINSHKVYHVEGVELNRVIVKCYNKDLKYIDDYILRANEIFKNNIFILDNFDEMNTKVYFKCELIKTYDQIITSSILITKELIDDIKDKL